MLYFSLILFNFLSWFSSDENNIQEQKLKKIFFLHIPKTAGTSVSTFLNKNLNLNAQFLFPDVIILKKIDTFSRYPNYLSFTQYREFLKANILKDANNAFATTHIPFFLLQDFYKNLITLTILRDPIKRQLSYLRLYAIQKQTVPALVEYANNHILSSAYTYNFQTLYLSQLNPWDPSISIQDHLESAKDVLANKITFFGLTECLEDSLNEFCKTLNITPTEPLTFENTTFDKNVILEEEIDEDLLIKENWADIELYNFAKELFYKRYPHLIK